MDAVEYLKERDRMCNSPALFCGSCRLRAEAARGHETCVKYIKEHPEEAVETVEQWAKEHPRKTRQSEFLKMFPRAGLGDDGLIVFCPEDFDSKFECSLKAYGEKNCCERCRKKYWLEEVEDDGD